MLVALSYPVACYVALAVVFVLNITSKPSPKSIFCETLYPLEIEAFRRFHWFVIYPGGAQMISWVMNILRFLGLAWALGCLIFGYYWVAGAMGS